MSERMKILYVSRSPSGRPHPFVVEQANSTIRNYTVQIDQYFIEDGLISGYLKTFFRLPRLVKAEAFDIVHVHNGISAFVVILSKIFFHRSMKVIITFHGSDLNNKSKRKYSLFASGFSAHNVLVSDTMVQYIEKNYSIISCGIDTDIELKYRDVTRRENLWSSIDFIILFSSNFQRKEKDPEFAHRIVEAFTMSSEANVKFIELKGFSRGQLTRLMQAADVLFMCSTMEGSPQVIKEAILNSLPVISNDVGDVATICDGVDNCFIVEKTVPEYLARLNYIKDHRPRVQRRHLVLEKYDNNIIAKRLYNIYKETLLE